ncbi:MAG: hypothetical protein K8L99_33120 [Anaerolineae bacterium]|nr:hypothetical protein [Anaerolineae bacterium]
MIKNIQRLPRGQRIVVFALFLGGALLSLVALTAILIYITFNNADRTQGVGLIDGVTVRELATLPDDDAYPASVAVGPDGNVYTGSYVTGAIWRIDQAGNVTEISGTRDAIGAVAGLTITADGSILVVDQYDADALTLGGDVKQVTPDGSVRVFATGGPDNDFTLPDDITLDSQGNVYITDRGRGEVWRFAPDGSGGSAWWVPPAGENDAPRKALTGLAYDPAHNAILVTDSNLDAIYRVSIDSGSAETLYQHQGSEFPPGLDGITAASDGTLYVATVTQNGVATLDDTGELAYIAGAFRGDSDVEYHDGQIYVANFDSYSLVVTLISPRLPFGIDVITLN